MRHNRFIPAIAALVLFCGIEAFPMGGSYPTDRPLHFNKGPKGLAEIVDTKNRVHGLWVNWNDWFYYSGDAKVFNGVLEKYAKLEGIPHILVLHEDAGMTGGLGDPKDIPFDWEIGVWMRWGNMGIPKDPNDPGSTQVAVVQLHLGGRPGVRPGVKLEDVKVPVAVHVEAADQKNAPDATNLFIARHRARQAAWKRARHLEDKKKPGPPPGTIMVNCVLPDQKIVLDPAKQVVEMKIAGASGDGRETLGFPSFQWLLPSDRPPENLRAEPRYESARPIYFAARYGDGKDNVHTLVIDESRGTGAGYDCLYVDADNDNRIDAQKERLPFQLAPSERSNESVAVTIHASAGGKTAPYHFRFSAFPSSDGERGEQTIHACARDGSYYAGEAIIGGRLRRIAVADLNGNGLYGDHEEYLFCGDRFFVDLNGDGRFRRSPAGEESYPCADYTWIAGEWYQIRPSPDGGRIEITRAEPAMATLRVPKHASGIHLKRESPKTELVLSVTRGGGRGSAGTYKLEGLTLQARDDEGRMWAVQGGPGDASPEIKIARREEARIAGGMPFRVEIAPSRSKKAGSIDLALKITGAAGGDYRLTTVKSAQPAGGFEIQNERGKTILAADFAPG